MQLSLIWAMAENRVIGRNNSLPWRLPNDMRHFMKTTMGRPVIMGRKTFESMKSPLPGRTNIVLTQNAQWQRDGVQVVATLDEAIALAESQSLIDGVDEVMVIGGAQIYELALPLADRLYLTTVHAEPQGDVFFPPVDLSGWQVVEEERCEADERHSSAYTFQTLERAS
jgi:dihydrofolate reductase